MKATEAPMNLEEVVSGVEFPATKIELTEYAIENGASERALEAFRALPDLTYNSMKDLNKDLGKIAAIPGNDNIWESTEA